MKKIIILVLTICMLIPSLAFAKKKTEADPVAARYASVLETFGATDAESLYQSILDYQNEIHPEEHGHYTVKHYPLTIRFGGTTKELIADKKNWGMAIVSSKEVDIRTLVDKGLIKNWKTFVPVSDAVLAQWLLPQNLKALLPEDRNRSYDFYFFDYDAQTDDATLFIMNAKKVDASNIPETLMNMRTPEAKRMIDGISRVDDWTEEQLIASPNDWDVANVHVKLPDALKQLDQAGLLLDFSQLDDLAARETIPDAHNGYGIMPNGVFSEDGRMIGIPACPCEPGHEDELEVMVINANSQHVERALEYALHYFKCADWVYSAEYTWEPVSDELAAEYWK
ncbi:MAG: hypothetical protein RRZ24_11810 [Clostridia bacterium]